MPVHYHEFSTLAASYLEQLYNTAKRMTGNAQEAEDLVQETYQRAFQAWYQLKDPAHCRAWLYQIMRRLFIDAHRRKRATPELVVLEGGHETDDTLLAIPVGSFEEEVIGRLSVEEIRRALSLLPEELRTALLLHSLEGFTYPEIAEILGCPVSTVRTRTMKVEIDFPNPEGLLRPGMYGNLTLNLETHAEALTLPAPALVTEKGKTFVYVVEDGKARRVEVTTDIDDGIRVEITKGLQGNEAVIVGGASTVTDGGAVQAITAAAA